MAPLETSFSSDTVFKTGRWDSNNVSCGIKIQVDSQTTSVSLVLGASTTANLEVAINVDGSEFMFTKLNPGVSQIWSGEKFENGHVIRIHSIRHTSNHLQLEEIRVNPGGRLKIHILGIVIRP
ncbi:hypothetical protein HK096_006263 [Nowakowskiella sp. JEL0078]|nr:hypothetical protein HK096_006263 [Nowakowskiella sp. JEL0078]